MCHPKKCALLVLAVLLLGVPSLAAPPEKAPATEAAVASGADIVFLVDASGSVQTTDPDSDRRTVIRAIIDLALRRGGDRVAIYRFAGRSETAERAAEAETLALTKVPTDATRKEVLDRLHAAAGRAAQIFPGALATDFNAAFEVGLARIIAARGDSKRPLWIVLLSDGDSEVERGTGAHAAYVDEAQRRYGKTLTRYLNKAATDLLRDNLLPKFAGPRRFFTAINVAAEEVADGDALKAVASCGRGGDVLRVTDQPLRDLVLPAFRAAPDELGRPVAAGIAYESLSIDGHVDRTFRTCGRLGRTGLLVFAETSDFEVDVARPDGEPLTEGSVEISGLGERYRVVTVAGLPSGEYRLRIRSPQPIKAERIVYHEMDVAVKAALVEPKTVFRPGESIDLEIRLVDRRTGRTIADADVLKDALASITVETPSGGNVIGDVSLNEPSGVALETWTIPTGAERGTRIVDIRAIGLKDPGGEPGLRAESRGAVRFNVIPALAVTWDVGEVDEAGTASLRGRPPAGDLPHATSIPVRLVADDADLVRTASLSWSAESGAWVATVENLVEGNWRIRTPPDARIEILPGDVDTIHVVVPGVPEAFPWLPVTLLLILIVLLLAVLGLLRARRRRRVMVMEDAVVLDEDGDEDGYEAVESDEGLYGAADEDMTDLDEDDILLDDDDMEEYLAAHALEAEEREPEPVKIVDADGEDFETLILDEE
jgi:von Willebrand factor type A domain